jgi:hypothetical protein
MQEQAIKEKVKEKIALTENSESCCAPTECCAVISAVQMAKNIGYDTKDLETVPETSMQELMYFWQQIRSKIQARLLV